MVANFRWIDEGVIAGSSRPSSAEEVQWLHEQGIRAIVSLHPVPEEVREEIERRGIAHKHLLVEDFGVPDEQEIDEFFEFVGEQAEKGNPCLVHCYAGVGRTGTMLALYLVSRGMDVQAAIDRLGGLEALRQRQLIFEFAGRRRT